MSDLNKASEFCSKNVSNCKRCVSNNCNDYDFFKVTATSNNIDNETDDHNQSDEPYSEHVINVDISSGSFSPKSFTLIIFVSIVFINR